MRLARIAALSASWVALGCSLFSKSDDNSPGANAPIMYGTGPSTAGPAGSGGSTTGIHVDAAVSGSGGTGGSDAGTDAAKPADAASHADAQRWIHFPAYYTFAKCTWFSASDGFCSEALHPLSGQTAQHVGVYKTSDGGMTWIPVSTIDTQALAPDANLNVYVLSPVDLWFISGSLAAGQSGSIGHSPDGGTTWISLTNAVSALLSPPAAGDGGVASVPVWQLASQGGRIWLLPQGKNLVYSQDAGITWKTIAPPADFGAATNRSLIATQGYLLLQFLAADNSLGFYRWNDTAFVPVQGTLPPSSAGDQTGTWWRASPSVEGVLFMDRGPLPDWASPFWVYATVDGGQTFKKILGWTPGTNDIVGLSDGLAFAFLGSVTSDVSGIFADGNGGRYLEIHRTSDAGKTWSTVHSEPSSMGDNRYISLAVDSNGAVHAMHTIYNGDNLGAPITYDAHYVLP